MTNSKKLSRTPYGIFKTVITASVIIAAISVILMIYVNPQLVDRLAFKDGPVEWLSALLLIAATVFMIACGVA